MFMVMAVLPWKILQVNGLQATRGPGAGFVAVFATREEAEGFAQEWPNLRDAQIKEVESVP